MGLQCLGIPKKKIQEYGHGYLAARDRKGGYAVLAKVNGVLKPVIQGSSRDELARKLQKKIDYFRNPKKIEAEHDSDRRAEQRKEMESVKEDFAKQAGDLLLKNSDLRDSFHRPKSKTDGKGPNHGTKYHGKDFNRNAV